MSSDHHYVSLFHLRQFAEDGFKGLLWHGCIPDGPVTRRAPKSIGTEPLMFDGPGGLSDRNATLESFLANEIEGPAAKAMREVCNRPPGSGGELPPALTRYLAWAAARSRPMRKLEERWASNYRAMRNATPAEPPPEQLMSATELRGDVQMAHVTLGARVFSANSDFERLADEGWFPDPRNRSNFLQMVHIQACYFQMRFFPRFKWFTLHAPAGEYFIIADRAVGWAADGYIDAPPSCLRDPSAYVLAPISRSLVLVGRHSTDAWQVTPAQINTLVACWAHEWIAGPNEQNVVDALDARRVALATAGPPSDDD